MRISLQFSADLITFTEKILKGKLNFFCSETIGACSKEIIKLKENIVAGPVSFSKNHLPFT